MANDFALGVGEFGCYPPPTVYQLCVSVRGQKTELHLMASIENACTNKIYHQKIMQNRFYFPKIQNTHLGSSSECSLSLSEP